LVDFATVVGATWTGDGFDFITGVEGEEGMVLSGPKAGRGGGGGTSSFSRSNASSSFSKSELALADSKRQKLIKKEIKNRLNERI